MTMDMDEAVDDLRHSEYRPPGADEAIELVLARLAEVEAKLAELTATEPAWAVQWTDPDGDPDADGLVIEIHDDRESAERVRDRYRAQGAELVQAVRGPWTVVES